MSQQFQAANPDDLILHELDAMTAIFHRPSGLTHVVADPVPAILEVMGASAMTAATVARLLSEQFELEPGADVENVVLARLDELCALGLAEQVKD